MLPTPTTAGGSDTQEIGRIGPVLERGIATCPWHHQAEAPQPSRQDLIGKERKFRGCHGSGSMGPRQENKIYSLQAYFCSFIKNL